MDIDKEMTRLFNIRKELIRRKLVFEVKLDKAVVRKLITNKEKSIRHEKFMDSYLTKRLQYDSKWLKLNDKKRSMQLK